MTNISQKWPKNRVFGLLKKITSLVLSEICVKWKFLWFINIFRKLHAWEKWGKTACWFSSYSQKYLLANNISVFFNCQYFTNSLTYEFDFWHVDTLINRFSEKILIWANGPFWAQKLCILVTLDPLEEFFLNFAQWKGLIGRWEWY